MRRSPASGCSAYALSPLASNSNQPHHCGRSEIKYDKVTVRLKGETDPMVVCGVAELAKSRFLGVCRA
jgi:hypothetical protein